jgi:CDP-4-dehydro-6-deoxyglucose reductase
MPNVTVHPGGETIFVTAGETVLGGLYKAGFAYRVGCRRGGCGICKVGLVAGDVTYTHVVADSVLPAEERANGVCLSCRAVPEGDITIELRDDELRRTNPLLRWMTQAAQTSAELATGTTTKE